MTNFELLFIGDACPVFKAITASDWFSDWKQAFKDQGNDVFFMNNVIGGRDYGAKVTNQAIAIARGQYFMFADNDDRLLEDHIGCYYNSIVQSGCDFVYNQVAINQEAGLYTRTLSLNRGCVGHAELIIRTEFLKKMPKHEPVYGQDWILIEEMMKRTDRHKRGETPFPTYLVMSTHNYTEPGYENDN